MNLKRIKHCVKPAKDIKIGDVILENDAARMVRYSAPSYMIGSWCIQHSGPKDLFYNRVTKNIPQDEGVVTLTGRLAQRLTKEYEEAISLVIPEKFMMTSGADPEIFVVDKDGAVIPAWNFLGSKKQPNRAQKATYGNNAIYWDGFQAEFDVSANACLAWTVDSVHYGLRGLYRAAKAHNSEAKLSIRSVLPVSDDILKTAANEHVQFGCMPSKNVYGLYGNTMDGREVPMRFAGGHVHIGLPRGTPNPEITSRIVKAMDAICGVACVSLFENFDVPVRRQFYGLAGEYRTPAHGIEYRALSNAWLMHPLVMNIVFDLARRAATYGFKNLTGWKSNEADVIAAIQGCDAKLARKILKDNEAYLVKLMAKIYYDTDITKLMVKLLQGGAEEFVKDPEDLVTNWDLGGDVPTWITHSDGQGNNMSKAFATISKKGKV